MLTSASEERDGVGRWPLPDAAPNMGTSPPEPPASISRMRERRLRL